MKIVIRSRCTRFSVEGKCASRWRTNTLLCMFVHCRLHEFLILGFDAKSRPSTDHCFFFRHYLFTFSNSKQTPTIQLDFNYPKMVWTWLVFLVSLSASLSVFLSLFFCIVCRRWHNEIWYLTVWQCTIVVVEILYFRFGEVMNDDSSAGNFGIPINSKHNHFARTNQSRPMNTTQAQQQNLCTLQYRWIVIHTTKIIFHFVNCILILCEWFCSNCCRLYFVTIGHTFTRSKSIYYIEVFDCECAFFYSLAIFRCLFSILYVQSELLCGADTLRI